jgi:integrase
MTTKRAKRRQTFDDADVAALRPKTSRYAFPDPELHSHYIRVTPNGVKSFVVVALDVNGKQTWKTIGTTAEFGIEKAREEAKKKIAAIKTGADLAGPKGVTTVAEEWFASLVKKGLRTTPQVRRYLDKFIIDQWKTREIASITRTDVAKLLDHVEDHAGPVAADRALAYLSAMFNWHEARSSEFTNPMPRSKKNLRKSDPIERARDRFLTDAEIKDMWHVVNGGLFGNLIKTLLLTGQRKDKVLTMRWQDISIDGTWTIPTEKREKSNAKKLKLSPLALDIIREQPVLADNPYVFASRGSYFKNDARAMEAVRAKLVPPVDGAVHWIIHDLRRTAKTLMQRAGVRPDIAERVLGHKIKGVEGIYDRHDYAAEKATALVALADLIIAIVGGADVAVAVAAKLKKSGWGG